MSFASAKQGELSERLVSEADIRRYELDGVVCLRGLFNEGWLERLRAATQRSLEAGGTEMSNKDDAGRFHSNLFMWKTDPDFRAFVFESPAARIAKEIMRASQVRFYFDHLFIKEPGTQTPTPWHHDQPYWPVRGEQVASIWVTLDPVTRQTSGLEYIKGSHRWGKRFNPTNFGASKRAEGLTDEVNDVMPDINSQRDQYEFLTWEMKPGDCLVHHSLAVHGSGGNTSSTIRRRALSTRWLGDDAVYWPHEHGQHGGLDDPSMIKGQRINAEIFPLIDV